jgi:hypothetical protein
VFHLPASLMADSIAAIPKSISRFEMISGGSSLSTLP